MARANWYDAGNSDWVSTDGTAYQPGPDPALPVKYMKRVRVYDAVAGVWRRATAVKVFKAAAGAWTQIHTGLPATPTSAAPIAYLSDASICTTVSPRTEAWHFHTTYSLAKNYVGIYRIQAQLTRNGVGQGWVYGAETTIADGTQNVHFEVLGSWSSGAPHGTLGTGTGYDTALWGIEARYVDIESGGIGPSNGTGTTNQISLFLPYC